MLRTGIDIIEVCRIDEAILSHGERFLERVYTESELVEANGRTPSLAARLAAKEAVSKALGCGIGKVGWRDIEITRDQQRRPLLRLYGPAQALAAEMGLEEWSLSLSHTHDHAAAVVVASCAGSLPAAEKALTDA
ncbi:MAG: holo-ACP synthase [Anaerolineales bacterium]|jgi:holo-[acyl-carrier protein] synthase|nr:holo-ACP synthase [Anaerolineales bacterium]MDP7544831.1 holo-ACP synthase [Anaerolineales bacterium]MDP7643317.1 holo-ACP synthase [Anaerolineales bacterium]HJN40517.1 holo-ACP synthase [Anaerolineales bacterium]|tara:strand:- start:1029 stop:1433 length:405 start_codon:yes stop_codon:yes gene_type:complete